MSENIVEIKILSVKILSFSFTHKDNLDISDDIDFTFESKIQLKVNNDEIDIKYSLEIFISESNIEVVNLQVLSTYLIKDLDRFKIADNEYDFPENIVEGLIDTSVSNTRGVLSVKVNETGFKNLILPLIQMQEFSEERKPKRKTSKK